jgi:hypothetical protein
MNKRLKGVGCFKCEVQGKKVPAEVIAEYLGLETPLCLKCAKQMHLHIIKDE